MAETLNVGIIGIGFVGAAHVDAVRRIPGAEIVAVASSTPERAHRHAAALGIPRAYAGYRELLADPDIHIVHNCTPNVLHFPINRATIEAGKACFSEKPLTMTAAEADTLVRLARTHGVPTAVNFNHRGFPQVQEARALIEAGELGRVHAVHGSYLQDWLLLETDWNWRLDPDVGGATRVVADIGSHWMDLAQHVIGSRISAVMADLGTLFSSRLRPEGEVETFQQDETSRTRVEIKTEDFASVLVRFENGARGAFTVSQVSAGRKNRLALEVDGGAGSLAWLSEDSEWLWRGSRTAGSQLLQRSPAGAGVPGLSRLPAGHAEGWSDALVNVIRSFYEQVQGAPVRPWVATLEDGAYGMHLVEAILKSSREERWIEIADGA